MKQNVEKVVLDILVKNNKMKTKILLFGILSIMILGSFVSCKSVKPEPLSEDARLRASYYFVEGVKKSLLPSMMRLLSYLSIVCRLILMPVKPYIN